MRNLIATTPFMNEVKKIRKAIHENIIDFMKENNCTEMYCTESDNSPVIYNGICEDDFITLDAITLYKGGSSECIIFEGSGEFENGDVYLNDMDIELLVGVYEWIMANKDSILCNV